MILWTYNALNLNGHTILSLPHFQNTQYCHFSYNFRTDWLDLHTVSVPVKYNSAPCSCKWPLSQHVSSESWSENVSSAFFIQDPRSNSNPSCLYWTFRVLSNLCTKCDSDHKSAQTHTVCSSPVIPRHVHIRASPTAEHIEVDSLLNYLDACQIIFPPWLWTVTVLHRPGLIRMLGFVTSCHVQRCGITISQLRTEPWTSHTKSNHIKHC